MTHAIITYLPVKSDDTGERGTHHQYHPATAGWWESRRYRFLMTSTEAEMALTDDNNAGINWFWLSAILWVGPKAFPHNESSLASVLECRVLILNNFGEITPEQSFYTCLPWPDLSHQPAYRLNLPGHKLEWQFNNSWDHATLDGQQLF